MNKKILTVSAILAAASLSFGFETWFGADGVERVITDLDAGDDNSGYWYSYADDADGGVTNGTTTPSLRLLKLAVAFAVPSLLTRVLWNTTRSWVSVSTLPVLTPVVRQFRPTLLL